ncbi:MAG: prefoldin subunit beta [Candidatus Aenigmarchaeota archaeon]|nr:prefoldin subunit beta [Candidatus Aenigmarchaeota archaeon]
MNEKISPEAQKVFIQLQQMQKQMQNIDMQRQSLTYQKMEIEKALEEVKKCEEKEEMFKIVGPVLIKSSKEKLDNELSETMETIEKNLKIIEDSEKKIGEKMASSQEKLQEILSDKKPATEAG